MQFSPNGQALGIRPSNERRAGRIHLPGREGPLGPAGGGTQHQQREHSHAPKSASVPAYKQVEWGYDGVLYTCTPLKSRDILIYAARGGGGAGGPPGAGKGALARWACADGAAVTVLAL